MGDVRVTSIKRRDCEGVDGAVTSLLSDRFIDLGSRGGVADVFSTSNFRFR